MRRTLVALATASAAVLGACAPTAAPPTTSGGVRASTFGNAPWNRTVTNMATHPRSAEFSARLFNYSNFGGFTNPTLKGKFSTYFGAYSQPIYDARQATGTIRVFRAGFGFPGSIANGGTIPWNPAWQPPSGTDRSLDVVDPTTGREWDLWLVQTDNKTSCITLENLALGFDTGGYNLCVGQADLVQDSAGQPIDYRTYEGGYPTGGAFIQGLAMLTTADEVAAGVIPHALNAVVYDTMFGSLCSAAQKATAAAGVDCSFYENPANRVEWTTGPQPCGSATQVDSPIGRSKTVAQGMRFAIHVTDAQIDQWLNTRNFTPELRNTARIFAVALRDYGFIVTNTSCYDAGFITDGVFNPKTKAKWQALGVTNADDVSLVHGLITADNLWTVAPSEALSVGSQTPAA